MPLARALALAPVRRAQSTVSLDVDDVVVVVETIEDEYTDVDAAAGGVVGAAGGVAGGGGGGVGVDDTRRQRRVGEE